MVQGSEDWSPESRGRSIIYGAKSINKTTFSSLEDSGLVRMLLSG